MPADAHLAALACAALHPGLRSVLVFDLPPWAFSRVIETRQSQVPRRVHLGLANNEDTLHLEDVQELIKHLKPRRAHKR